MTNSLMAFFHLSFGMGKNYGGKNMYRCLKHRRGTVWNNHLKRKIKNSNNKSFINVSIEDGRIQKTQFINKQVRKLWSSKERNSKSISGGNKRNSKTIGTQI